MKNKILTILCACALLSLAGCSKGKFCKCTLDNESNEVRIVNVDYGTSCKNLQQIGIEEQYTPEGDTIPSLRRSIVDMSCEKIKAKELEAGE